MIVASVVICIGKVGKDEIASSYQIQLEHIPRENLAKVRKTIFKLDIDGTTNALFFVKEINMPVKVKSIGKHSVRGGYVQVLPTAPSPTTTVLMACIAN